MPSSSSSSGLGTPSRPVIPCGAFRRGGPAWRMLICGWAVFSVGCGHELAGENEGARSTDAVSRRPTPAGERWDVYFIKDPGTGERRKAGYRHTVQREVVDGRQRLIRTVAVDRLRFFRFGHPTQVEMRCESLRSQDGQVDGFQYEVSLGPEPQRTVGRIQGGRLLLEITAAGTTSTRRLDWPGDCEGIFGVEHSLRRNPLQPGQRRKIHVFLPMVDAVAPVELTADGYEVTSLLQRRERLLAVSSRTSLPDGQVMKTRLWINPSGEILKSRTAALGQEVYRTDRRTAERSGGTAPLDVGLGLIVKTEGVPDDIHRLAEMTYVVKLQQDDPSRILGPAPGQTVRALGPKMAAVTVRAVRPDSAVESLVDPDPPTDRDSEPSSALQSDDASIVELARRVAPDQSDPWRLAVALERFVHDYVESNDFSHVFATALEVAENRQGDCTEYAVLLAALCRARDIPSRIAVGLVYVPEREGFLYHMWNTVWIEDRWVPLDATLGLGGTGAGHLTLGISDMHGTSVYVSLLPVLKVMGRLTVDVADGA